MSKGYRIRNLKMVLDDLFGLGDSRWFRKWVGGKWVISPLDHWLDGRAYLLDGNDVDRHGYHWHIFDIVNMGCRIETHGKIPRARLLK